MRELFLPFLMLGLHSGIISAGNARETIQNLGYGKLLSNLGPLGILGDYLTPTGVNVSRQCQQSGEMYKTKLMENSPWALQMFDADPKFPQAGVMDGNMISFPGAFDECLKADSGRFRGKYCLMGI